MATDIMQKFDFTFLDNNPDSLDLRIFNGRIWASMSGQELEQLVYNELTPTLKRDISGIKQFCRKVADYIMLETRKKSIGRFSEKHFRKVLNHVVFSNCVYDIKKDLVYPFSKELPYSMEAQCAYLSEDKPTPYYDRLRREATGDDPDSMEMFNWMIGYLLIPNRSGKCFFDMCYAKDSGKTILGPVHIRPNACLSGKFCRLLR